MSEALISVDMNFNNGSGHTASTTSILGASALSQNSPLGAIIGKKGSRSDFSHSGIGGLFNNFIEVERTTSTDSVKTQITRKYIDRTTLLLQSHVILVRGRDVGPDKGLNYSGKIYEYAECAGSPVEGFTSNGAERIGGAIIIGQIYNEITETDEKTQNRASVVYKAKTIVEGLSYNQGGLPTLYKENPDLSKSKIKLGYTLNELKAGLGTAGISINGLPTVDILFDISGTAESVLSAIASTLGYYWYVSPFGEGVFFISSQAASQITISKSPSGPALDFSYTESLLRQTSVSTFWGSAGSQNNNISGPSFEFSNKERVARFRAVNALEELNINIDKSIFSLYYGAFAASAFNSTVFDAITYYLITTSGKELFKPKFGSHYAHELGDSKNRKWTDVYIPQLARELAEKRYQGPFNLKEGYFLRIHDEGVGRLPAPSNERFFKLLEGAFTLLDNTIFVSNKYHSWKAARMQMASSEANISGPHAINSKLNEINATQALAAMLKELGVENKTLEDLQDSAGVKGRGQYGFIGVKSVGSKKSGNSSSKYNLFNEENFLIYEAPYGITYAAFSKELLDTIKALLTESKQIFSERINNKPEKNTIRCVYTRLNRPVNDLDGKGELELDDQESESTVEESQQNELSDKFQEVKVSTRISGSTGAPLEQVKFELKNGTYFEVDALESAFAKGAEKGHTSNSTTLAGVHIPAFKPTLSSVSIKVSGGQGATTTISESSLKLLSPDDSLIIGNASKASSIKATPRKFNSRQRNTLGL